MAAEICNSPCFTQSATTVVLGTSDYPVLHLFLHLHEPWILIMDRGVAPVQVEGPSDLRLQKSHFQKVYCNTLGQYRFCPGENAIRSDVLIIDLFKKLDVDMIVTDRETAWTAKAM